MRDPRSLGLVAEVVMDLRHELVLSRVRDDLLPRLEEVGEVLFGVRDEKRADAGRLYSACCWRNPWPRRCAD